MKGYLITIFNVSSNTLERFIIKESLPEAESFLYYEGFTFDWQSNSFYKDILDSNAYGQPSQHVMIKRASIVEIEDDREPLKMMVEALGDKI